MANITETIMASAKPTVWVADALTELENYLVMGSLVDKRYMGLVPPGRLVNVTQFNQFADAAVRNKAEDTAFTQDTSTMTQVQINMSNDKYLSFAVEEIGEIMAKPEVGANFLKNAIIKIAEDLESALLAEHANAGNNTGTYGTDLTIDSFVDARKILVDNKCPVIAPKHAVISTKDVAALLKSDGLDDSSKAGDNMALRDARVGRLRGMDVFEHQLVDTTTATPTQTHNMVFTPEAITLVTASLPDLSLSDVRRINLVKDGFPLTLTISYDADNEKFAFVLRSLYGIKTMRSALSVELRS